MKPRFLLQAVAMVCSIVLILLLTLGALGKVHYAYFWGFAIFSLLVSFILHRN
jgi:hypothetical protein